MYNNIKLNTKPKNIAKFWGNFWLVLIERKLVKKKDFDNW